MYCNKDIILYITYTWHDPGKTLSGHFRTYNHATGHMDFSSLPEMTQAEILIAVNVVLFVCFHRSVTAYTSAHFGAVTGPTWLDDLHCDGTEKDIAMCDGRPWGDENCGHTEDAGVTCGEDRCTSTPIFCCFLFLLFLYIFNLHTVFSQYRYTCLSNHAVVQEDALNTYLCCVKLHPLTVISKGIRYCIVL